MRYFPDFSAQTKTRTEAQTKEGRLMGEMAEAAAAIIMQHFGEDGLGADYKEGGFPVTPADRKAEAKMRDMIATHFPSDDIFGEEQGGVITNTRLWVLDPIDGTKNFMTHTPLFSTMIAFLEGGRPRESIIALPALGEIWHAKEAGPTSRNGQGQQTRSHEKKGGEIGDAILLSTGPDLFITEDEKKAFALLADGVKFCSFGHDAFGYTRLAGGWADLVCEADLKPYDFLPLIPIVEGAGGIITDWAGGNLTGESKGHVLASANAGLHEQALERLNWL